MKRKHAITRLISSVLASVLIYVTLNTLPYFYCKNVLAWWLLLTIGSTSISWALTIPPKLWYKWCQLLTCITFLAILFFPVIQEITGLISWGKVPEEFDEKRVLAQKPEFDTLSVDQYAPEYTVYFNDNFEFRKWLIAWNNYLKVKLFNKSNLPEVTLGTDGWMYFTTYDVRHDHSGNLFSDEELEKIAENLNKRHQWLKDRNCSYYIAIAPDKITIQHDNVPPQFQLANRTRIDQLLPYLEKHTSIKVIDLRDTLKAQSQLEQVYFKTDSHWNQNGAFAGYKKIIETIRQDYPNIPLYDRSDYTVRETTQKQGGDLAQLLALKSQYTQRWFNYTPKEHVLKTTSTYIPEYQFYNEQYKVSQVLNSADTSLPRLVNFHDSFSGYTYEFLSKHFSKSVFLWTHDFRKDVMEREKPDIVLHTLVERSLAELGESKAYEPLN